MDDLASLIDDLPAGALPEGRLISGDDDAPAFWLSDAPAQEGAWTAFRSLHPQTGLWPLLLRGGEWEAGEVYPVAVAEHDVALQLKTWWEEYTAGDDGDNLSPEARDAVTAPYGKRWPGLCPPLVAQGPPESFADGYSDFLTDGGPRLALVAAGRGSAALCVAGWSGPVNYGETDAFAAVVADWEQRFGVRVVGLGFDTLQLSVGAPPITEDDALRVAAEHFAFCPDSVWQGSFDHLQEYAKTLLNLNAWTFWWD